jgi:UDP-glucuronate 4-epimerase
MKRDFTYIDDIVNGIIKALETDKKFEIYNLGNSSPVEIKELVQLIEKHLNKKAHIIFKTAPQGDVNATYANIKKAQKDLGFSPQTSISEGIKYFIQWYKDYYKIK